MFLDIDWEILTLPNVNHEWFLKLLKPGFRSKKTWSPWHPFTVMHNTLILKCPEHPFTVMHLLHIHVEVP